jgi:hypothetical protein
MRSTRLTILGLSVAILCLRASLALAGTTNDYLGVYRTARQGTVTAITGNQAAIELEDGTTLTLWQYYWQKGWQVGNRLQCITDYPWKPDAATTCERD